MRLRRIAIIPALCALLGTGTLPAQAAERALGYVTNQDGGISVVDLHKLEVIHSFEVQAKGPRGIGVTADGKYLITANRDGGNISIIERTTGKTVKQVPIGKNPEFVRVRGDRAYVTFEPASKGTPPQKEGQAKEPAAKEEEDEDREPAKIAVVDLKSFKVLRKITSGPETEGIEFSNDGKWMLVTNEADNTVTVHSMANGRLVKTVSTKDYGNRPRGIKASPDGKHYVVTLEFSDKFLVLDKHFKPIKAVETGKTPYGVAFDRAGKRLFVAASREKKLQVYDAQTFEPIDEMAVGDRCWHFSFTPDDSKIVVACGRSNSLYVFDATSYAPIKQIGGKNLPWGIVTYPRAVGSLDMP